MTNYHCMRICFGTCAAILVLALIGCGSADHDAVDNIGLSFVTFPNGTRITVETARTPLELIKGLMDRDSLPDGHGMLFTHPDENIYHYWMYRTKIPLDIIWMDHDQRIVEMSQNTPPCKAQSPKDCTNYGGNFKSKYSLEVNAGVAEKNKLQVGDVLRF